MSCGSSTNSADARRERGREGPNRSMVAAKCCGRVNPRSGVETGSAPSSSTGPRLRLCGHARRGPPRRSDLRPAGRRPNVRRYRSRARPDSQRMNSARSASSRLSSVTCGGARPAELAVGGLSSVCIIAWAKAVEGRPILPRSIDAAGDELLQNEMKGEFCARAVKSTEGPRPSPRPNGGSQAPRSETAPGATA